MLSWGAKHTYAFLCVLHVETQHTLCSQQKKTKTQKNQKKTEKNPQKKENKKNVLIGGASSARHVVALKHSPLTRSALVGGTLLAGAPICCLLRQIVVETHRRPSDWAGPLAYERSERAHAALEPQILYGALSTRWKYIFDAFCVKMLLFRTGHRAIVLIGPARLSVSAFPVL